MSLIFRIVPCQSADYAALVALRSDVLRKPLGLSFSPEDLEWEKDKIHMGGFLDGAVCASAMLVAEGAACKMQRVAVRKDLQSRGIGGALVAFFEDHARKEGFFEVYCHARATAVPFYLRHGYIPEGEPFNEQTIPHLRMRKRF